MNLIVKHKEAGNLAYLGRDGDSRSHRTENGSWDPKIQSNIHDSL